MSLDFYQILGLIANLSVLASNIIVFAIIYRVMGVVRHSCLQLIGFSCLLGFISGVVFICLEIPLIPLEALQVMLIFGCAVVMMGSISFGLGMWQLLHWIPELLELRVLDQRDEPFPRPPDPPSP